MRKHDEQQLDQGELSTLKDMVGQAETGEISLEEILAEYSVSAAPSADRPVPPGSAEKQTPPVAPQPEVERTPPPPPKTEETPAPPKPAPPQEEARGGTAAFPQQKTPDSPLDQGEGGEGSILPFPKQADSALGTFLKDISHKADRYAERMFEEDEQTDHAEVRRIERLIPGTDLEQSEPDLRRARPPAPPEPPLPDLPPQELAKQYAKGLMGLRIRALILFCLGGLAIVQLLMPTLGLDWSYPAPSAPIQLWIANALLGFGILLGYDVWMVGLTNGLRRRAGMDTLMLFACLFTLLDGLFMMLEQPWEGRLPYSAVILTGLFFQLHGIYHKKCAQRLACRTAAASASAYRVTLDEARWDGHDAYFKWKGDARQFGSQIQADDGAARIFHRVCPLFILGCILMAVLTTVRTGQTQQVVWALSAMFTVTSAFGGAIVYGRSFHKITRRLAQSGAALAGWPGIRRAARGNRVLLADQDLFPPGSVEIIGFQRLGDFSVERVLAYTATLIRDSGSGLSKIFHDQLRAAGGLMRTASGLSCHEAGGLSAVIRGERVLVGSAAFMQLMEITLPPGLNVKHAVFCAINEEPAGIFALNYTLPNTINPALAALIHAKLGPVLATRDFSLTPAMLAQRFKLPADKLEFPAVERRWELSDQGQSHSDVPIALLCREGLLPLSEALVAATRLRRATRAGAWICCIASLLGLQIVSYLVSVSAHSSLSPLNLLLYMVAWLAPVWFLSGWVHRY